MDPDGTKDLPDELDDGLAFAYGEDGAPDSLPSVIERIGKRTGSRPSVALRDADAAEDASLLRPLGPDDPHRAGKYMIHGELGRGGVGAVHRGHDRDLGRDVALKFLQGKYRDEREILQRFVEEAQIGGQLQHPGIVPVYDLGMTNGQPFFAMKLVKGETLAKKLSRRASPADDRRTFLATFEDVCQTMAYAHARGVVHRDLKPANVMIGSFGEVQVVDWGMGKVLQQGGIADERLAHTPAAPVSSIQTVRSRDHGSGSVAGSVMGTPAYMPPEQARGEVESMDERSDVFALGAILCEILTGSPPYTGPGQEQLRRAAAADLVDAQERLAKCGAEAELVDLALRCLRAAPGARPRDAEVVAHAVHAHLAGVEARLHDARVEAAEARVRAAGLKRAQTLGLGLTAAIAAGLVASLWLWRDAEAASRREERARLVALAAAQEARDHAARAERELERATEIRRLITAMLQSVTPEQAQLTDTTLMKGLLDDAAARLGKGVVTDELVAAELHQIVGDTYRTLALYEQAERHLPEALAIRTRVQGEDHHDTLSVRAALAHLRYAEGRFDVARTDLVAVVDLHRCAQGPACPVLQHAQTLLATTVQRFGRFDEAERLYVGVREVQERVLGEDALETLESGLGLGMLYFQEGRLGDAERVLRETLDGAERVLGEVHPHTVRTKRSLANLCLERGRNDEAWRLYRECIEAAEALWGPEHAETLIAKQALAVVDTQRGDAAAAEALLLETLEAHRRALGKEHPMTLVASANLAAILLETGRFEEAGRQFEEILELQRSVLGAESPDTLRTQVNLATAHLYRNRSEEAGRLCHEALEAQERVLGAENPDTLHSKWIAARIHLAAGRYDEAEALLIELLEVRHRTLGADHPDTLVTIETLAGVQSDTGRLDEAEVLFVEALEGWTRLVGAGHPQALFVQMNLAGLRLRRGHPDEAEADLADLVGALEGMERILGPEHPHTLVAADILGQAHAAAGDHVQAIATLEPRLATLRRIFGDGDARVTGALEALATSQLELGRREQALPLFDELLERELAAAESSGDAVRLNEAAWTLLTHRLEELQDPERGLELAERARAVAEGGGNDASLWRYLDTLALAQYRTGDARAALATQRRALSLLPEDAGASVTEELRERQAEYRSALD